MTRVHRTALCIIQFFRIGNKGEIIQFYLLTAYRILESPTYRGDKHLIKCKYKARDALKEVFTDTLGTQRRVNLRSHTKAGAQWV